MRRFFRSAVVSLAWERFIEFISAILMVERDLTYKQLKHKLKLRLDELIHNNRDNQPLAKLDREIALRELRQTVLAPPRAGSHQNNSLSEAEQEQLVCEVLDEMVGLGPLDSLLADNTISEIMVNGPYEIFIERNGRIQRENLSFRDSDHLMSVIERMLEQVHLSVNEASGICDASLPDGTRINVIIPPLVLKGPVVTIRRKLYQWTAQQYMEQGALNEQLMQFFEACIKAKVNMIISGGTSTGKTTLVNVLSAFIPKEERIITIENVPELELQNREHWIRLVAKPANVEGKGGVPLRTLVRNALRMRPDRIILGEARGEEALDVVQAMHTGHEGFLTVLHANDPSGALERLETLMLMSGLDLTPQVCRTQIASATDLVVHLARFVDGNRGISSVTQVLGMSQEGYILEDLFALNLNEFSSGTSVSGALHYTGMRPKFMDKFKLHNVSLPDWINTKGER